MDDYRTLNADAGPRTNASGLNLVGGCRMMTVEAGQGCQSMRNIQVDEEGEFHCWNCGGTNFQHRRTGRAHVIGYTTIGLGALLTKKKLRCLGCGSYNQTLDAEPYRETVRPIVRDQPRTGGQGPISSPRSEVPRASPPAVGSKIAQLGELADLKSSGSITEAEYESLKQELLSSEQGGDASHADHGDLGWTVVLGNPGRKKIHVIKEVRAFARVDLKQAKDLVETAQRGTPVQLAAGCTRPEADRALSMLRAVGASAEIQPT